MLYICPTPIGNLKDITLRTIEVLKKVDEIACEDTRVSIKLLNHFDIKKPLFSYHEHNEQSATAHILNKLKNNLDIALISDAGMPGISDPGEVLIKACIDAGIDYTILPGANAVLTALVGSHIVTQPFFYKGFLDRKHYKKELEAIKHIQATLIFYVSPHHLIKTLDAVLEILGNRPITLARELTKKYEQYLHTTVLESIEYYTNNKPRGEYVLIVKGHTPTQLSLDFDEAVKCVTQRVALGEHHKEVVKEISKMYHIDRQRLYKETL